MQLSRLTRRVSARLENTHTQLAGRDGARVTRHRQLLLPPSCKPTGSRRKHISSTRHRLSGVADQIGRPGHHSRETADRIAVPTCDKTFHSRLVNAHADSVLLLCFLPISSSFSSTVSDLAPNPSGTGNKVPGVDHAKIAKLDRENEVAPPPTVSLELGKVLQQARQNFKDAEGKPKPMSQGDLAKAINAKQTVVQECESGWGSSSP